MFVFLTPSNSIHKLEHLHLHFWLLGLPEDILTTVTVLMTSYYYKICVVYNTDCTNACVHVAYSFIVPVVTAWRLRSDVNIFLPSSNVFPCHVFLTRTFFVTLYIMYVFLEKRVHKNVSYCTTLNPNMIIQYWTRKPNCVCKNDQ